jgi:hypothetical protein
MARTIAVFLMILSNAVRSDDQASVPVPLPEQPDLPPPVRSGQPLDPDVTIIRQGEETIEEYRYNNQIYMVKITPVIGPAYYLVDKDGDGNLDVRHRDNEKGMNINKWTLFSW